MNHETVLSLDVNGTPEYTTLVSPGRPNGSAILFTHGYEANSRRLIAFAQACSDQGTTGLAVDLLSHGQSGGDREMLTITDYLNGLSVAYDHLAQQTAVDASRIGTMAASFGAYLTVLLAGERPLKSLLLRVPALYSDNLRNVPRKLFNTSEVLRLEPDLDNSALGIVHAYIGKVVLVSSEHDEVIMPSTIEAYDRSITNGRHIQMAGAAHVLDDANRTVFQDILLKWAKEL